MKKQETIKELIDSFLEEVEYIVECFYKKYKRKDLLKTVIEGKIKRSGKIEGLRYYGFHGVGLFARRKNCLVDFDFGLNNRIDGFDSWRLYNYSESKKNTASQWTEVSIQKELDKLEINDEISKLKGDISSNYYYKNILSGKGTYETYYNKKNEF